jgi:Mrp family chromosome partitioning ATPase
MTDLHYYYFYCAVPVISRGACSPPSPTAIAEVADKMASVKHKILVLSGKGGVGKSTFSAQLSWYLATVANKQVGLMDIDICGTR